MTAANINKNNDFTLLSNKTLHWPLLWKYCNTGTL